VFRTSENILFHNLNGHLQPPGP